MGKRTRRISRQGENLMPTLCAQRESAHWPVISAPKWLDLSAPLTFIPHARFQNRPSVLNSFAESERIAVKAGSRCMFRIALRIRV